MTVLDGFGSQHDVYGFDAASSGHLPRDCSAMLGRQALISLKIDILYHLYEPGAPWSLMNDSKFGLGEVLRNRLRKLKQE